jgi:hypothetical protein
MLLLTLASCSSEDNEPNLPPETTTGENTAGFVVDGKKVILPKDKYSSTPGTGMVYGIKVQMGPNFNSSENNDYFTFRISNVGDPVVYSMNIRIHQPPEQLKKYVFQSFSIDNYADGPNYPQASLTISGKNIETQWYYSAQNSGSIIFTRIDATQRIFSGIFSATLYNRFDRSKTMQITKGRFDIDLKK